MRITIDKICDNRLSERANDPKVHLLQSIDKELSNKVASRFTGKVIFVLNLSQGGIGQCSIQTDTKLN
ncbi:MAG: hypothetical protein AB1847_06620 [bacterium]